MTKETPKQLPKQRPARSALLGGRRTAKEAIPLEITEAVKLATESIHREVSELRAQLDLVSKSASVAVHSLSFLYAALQEVSTIVGSRSMTASEGMAAIGDVLTEASQFVEASEYYNTEAAKHTIKKASDPKAENSKEMEEAKARLQNVFETYARRDRNLILLRVGINNRAASTGTSYLDDQIMGNLLEDHDGN